MQAGSPRTGCYFRLFRNPSSLTYHPRRFTQPAPPPCPLIQPAPPLRLTQPPPPLIHVPPRLIQPPPPPPLIQPPPPLTQLAPRFAHPPPPCPLTQLPRLLTQAASASLLFTNPPRATPPITICDHFFRL